MLGLAMTPAVAPLRSEGAANRFGLSLDHLEQDSRRSVWSSAMLLPILQRIDRETESL